MAENNEAFHALSLAVRARGAYYGGGKCEDKIKSGKAKLCVIACDASDNTIKKFTDMADFRGIDICRAFTKCELGRLFSREEVSVCVVTDDNLSLLLRGKLRKE